MGPRCMVGGVGKFILIPLFQCRLGKLERRGMHIGSGGAPMITITDSRVIAGKRGKEEGAFQLSSSRGRHVRGGKCKRRPG